MSVIEQYVEPSALAIADHRSEAVARLTEWATSATAAFGVAEQLVRTSFVPEGFRGKPHEATAAILAGIEVGLSPMASLRSFDVIQGQAAPRAITLRAILQSAGHEVVLVESTASRCRMRGRRRDSTEWQEVAWTIDRAKQLGVTGKANWKNQPQAMLVARATSELARLIASDAILGIGYSAEEVADGAGAGVEVATITTADPTEPGSPTSATGTKRMSRKKATPKAVEAAPTEPEPEPELAPPVNDDGEAMMTEPQKRKLFALQSEHGITERDDRIAFCSDVIGREIASSNDLTKADAMKIIDELEKHAVEQMSPPPDEEPIE